MMMMEDVFSGAIVTSSYDDGREDVFSGAIVASSYDDGREDVLVAQL